MHPDDALCLQLEAVSRKPQIDKSSDSFISLATNNSGK